MMNEERGNLSNIVFNGKFVNFIIAMCITPVKSLYGADLFVYSAYSTAGRKLKQIFTNMNSLTVWHFS